MQVLNSKISKLRPLSYLHFKLNITLLCFGFRLDALWLRGGRGGKKHPSLPAPIDIALLVDLGGTHL